MLAVATLANELSLAIHRMTRRMRQQHPTDDDLTLTHLFPGHHLAGRPDHGWRVGDPGSGPPSVDHSGARRAGERGCGHPQKQPVGWPPSARGDYRRRRTADGELHSSPAGVAEPAAGRSAAQGPRDVGSGGRHPEPARGPLSSPRSRSRCRRPSTRQLPSRPADNRPALNNRVGSGVPDLAVRWAGPEASRK